ncbi:MAG: flagellar basal body P-ring protein FlgI [Sedimentisphaerales bacterium]|nr:flagellar basal body P-ring protein FlgI [Sedimentisphaerales bacterium]
MITPPPSDSRGDQTIGDLCELMGYESVKVQGFSLVWGLPGTGSNECPSSKRSYLVQHIRKFKNTVFSGTDYEFMEAEQIIDSFSTAVVHVEGIVPAGAPEDTKFNVDVGIPWATQTTSLQGGILFPTELQVVVSGSKGRALASQRSAMAAGPIFINPFPLVADTGRKADPRKGIVLGGGISFKDRNIQLALLEPNSSVAQQIQRRINTRFQAPIGANVADANRNSVRIIIPDEYRDQYQHFIKLLLTIPLQDSALYQELKLKELSEQVKLPGANYEAITLKWEALGRQSLKYLQPLYEKGYGLEGFYAARTALNLGDKHAIDPLIIMAKNDQHICQLLAIQTLGQASDDIRSQAALAELIDHKNTRIRILAYQGLRRNLNRRIKSTTLPGGFKLESVNSTGENLICIWADLEPKVVLMGQNLKCNDNLFYETNDESIILNSHPDEYEIQISRKMPDSNLYISAESSLLVEDLVDTMARPLIGKNNQQKTGTQLTFSQIAGILYHLCQEKLIPAEFMLLRNSEDLIR